MTRRMAAQFHRLTSGAAIFKVPFHRGWLESLKAAVPFPARDWDPVSRTWEISAEYVDFTLRLSKTVFGRVDEVAQFRDAAPANAWRTLHLRETAPPELVDAAFRVLAKAAHPDAGGSHEQMLELAAARDACRSLAPR